VFALRPSLLTEVTAGTAEDAEKDGRMRNIQSGIMYFMYFGKDSEIDPLMLEK
jgi:hypothetical protein